MGRIERTLMVVALLTLSLVAGPESGEFSNVWHSVNSWHFLASDPIVFTTESLTLTEAGGTHTMTIQATSGPVGVDLLGLQYRIGDDWPRPSVLVERPQPRILLNGSEVATLDIVIDPTHLEDDWAATELHLKVWPVGSATRTRSLLLLRSTIS